jgi:hypothetical protein
MRCWRKFDDAATSLCLYDRSRWLSSGFEQTLIAERVGAHLQHFAAGRVLRYELAIGGAQLRHARCARRRR